MAPWQSILLAIGPILSGVGTLAIAIVAVRTLKLVGTRQVRLIEAQQQSELQKSFREQYNDLLDRSRPFYGPGLDHE